MLTKNTLSSTMYKTIQNQCFSFVLLCILFLLGTQHAFAAFTIDDEKKLGKEIYDKLEKNNFLLHDKILNNYVMNIGNRLLNHSNKAPFDFTFCIFNSSGINAFATPGGYIYVNKGLITAVENEAQLAGVIAHEIAHANSRHVASIIEKSQKLNIAMLAAIIAGAFLGGGGEATAAIAAFSMAGATSMQLKYTREHEEEADRLGIIYLVDSGYYPAAMVDFLKIIKQYEYYSKTIPSYLRTHPGTDDRIFYLDSLLQTQYLRTKGDENIVGNFVRMQALVILDEDNLDKHRRQLTEALRKDPRNVDLLYALALMENQQGQTGAALEHLNKALTVAPRDEDVLKNIGLLYLKSNNPGQACIHLQKAVEINPGNNQTILALGKAYFAMGDFKNALVYFLKIPDTASNDREKPSTPPDYPKSQEKPSDNVDINYYIAMSYGRLNQHGESHYYFGRYFKNEGKLESSLFHFNKSLEYYPQGSSRAIAISEIIKELNIEKKKKPEKKPGSPQNPRNKYHLITSN